MDNKNVVVDASDKGWEIQAQDLVEDGVPFTLKNFDYSFNVATFDLLERLAEQHGLEASFNLTEKEAVFELKVF